MRRTWWLVAGGIVVLAVLAYVGVAYFAPKPSTTVSDQALPGERVATATFHDGLPAHHVSGTVAIVRAADGSYSLRLEGYEATAGPDVYYYLTPSAHADSAAAVEGAGLRVLVPGGAADGQATLRGDFNVPLPAGFDPAKHVSLSVWCERYDAYFGGAEFRAA